MTENKDRILDKVIKLFALGGSDANTTEHEMMAAITAAKRLMARHNLHMAEVEAKMDAPTVSEVRRRVVVFSAYTRKIADFAAYDYCVARAVEFLTDTRAVIRKGRTTIKGLRYGDGYSVMQFVGTEADAELAQEIYIIFLESVRHCARLVYGKGWSASHTAYALGYGTRMARRAESMREVELTPQETQSLALIVRDKKVEIDRWLDANAHQGPPRKIRMTDHVAYAQGYHDAATADLSVKRRLR